ncbi:hypothetical protein E4U22_002336 [Claviceps purpurea]|nr:hypothetical protein E4U22_002336 [Claviceps purpurea]
MAAEYEATNFFSLLSSSGFWSKQKRTKDMISPTLSFESRNPHKIPPCTGCNNEAPLSEMATCNSCRGRGSAWQMLVSPAPVLNPGSLDTNFTEVFILHAKIFLFAVHYEVAELTNLSLRKLHQALCGFRLSKERVGDIMSLVRFCFDQNPDDDSGGVSEAIG